MSVLLLFAWLAWPDPDADLGNHVWGTRGVRDVHSAQALGLKLHHTHCSTSPIVKICIYFAIYMTCCTFLPLFADINLYLLRSMSSSHALNDGKVLDVLELQESQISVSPSPQPKVILSSHSLYSWPRSLSCSFYNISASQHPLKFILHRTDTSSFLQRRLEMQPWECEV